MVDPAFWKNKKVLLTGHTGFKGSWLSLWLEQMGAIVLGVSLPSLGGSDMFGLVDKQSSIQSEYFDITDLPVLLNTFAVFEPQIVLHLAAQSLVRRSYLEPVSTYYVNVIGTVNMLEAVRQSNSVRCLISVTSDKCYENREWNRGYRETDRLGGHDPYSNSKACAELVTQSYRDSFFAKKFGKIDATGVATARAGNVIGGGDMSEERLLPDLIRGFNASVPASIRNPSAVRPWQHVLEPLSGYMSLAQKLYESPANWSSAWNFGPDESGIQTVEEIANLAKQQFGRDADWIDTGGGDLLHEARYLKLDCSKARFELGSQPIWSVETAVNRTIDWDKARAAGEDMRAYSLREIEDYVGGMRVSSVGGSTP